MRFILVCLGVVASAAAWAQKPVERFRDIENLRAMDVMEACSPLIGKLDTGSKKPKKFTPTEQDTECWTFFANAAAPYCALNGFPPSDEAVRDLLLTWRWGVYKLLADEVVMAKVEGPLPFKPSLIGAMMAAPACQKKDPGRRNTS
jgi:hypothetical protein